MKLLFDTHAFIWWANEPNKLSLNALSHCKDKNNEVILSVVSVWEIQIKTQLGKLKLTSALKDLVEKQININRIIILPVQLNHVLFVENLPNHHKDPFDRLLIAQANEEGAHLVSADSIISNYSVNILW
jgi:PIN domain nuclease of toxin-antitoxin system